ncbi:MAG: GntR family transcriptional regulator [Bauldia litoralis]
MKQEPAIGSRATSKQGAVTELISAQEFAYNQIRQLLIRGELRAGQSLRQEDLARTVGVSRLPIREALNRLTAEGLVTLRPRRGYIVTSLNRDEIREIFELRMNVEEYAARLATQSRTPADIEAVEGHLVEMEGIELVDQERLTRWSECNRLFHERLFDSSGRTHVCGVVSKLRDAVAPYIRMLITSPEQVEEARKQHRDIFGAFHDGDVERAGAVSRLHCEYTADFLVQYLDTRNSAED